MPRRPIFLKRCTGGNAWVPFHGSFVRGCLKFYFCRGCIATTLLLGSYALCLSCLAQQNAMSSMPQASFDQKQEVIARIEFLGNRRLRSDTLKARIFSREGDPYDEEALRRDFHALWNTPFFEDLKLRFKNSPE